MHRLFCFLAAQHGLRFGYKRVYQGPDGLVQI